MVLDNQAAKWLRIFPVLSVRKVYGPAIISKSLSYSFSLYFHQGDYITSIRFIQVKIALSGLYTYLHIDENKNE